MHKRKKKEKKLIKFEEKSEKEYGSSWKVQYLRDGVCTDLDFGKKSWILNWEKLKNRVNFLLSYRKTLKNSEKKTYFPFFTDLETQKHFICSSFETESSQIFRYLKNTIFQKLTKFKLLSHYPKDIIFWTDLKNDPEKSLCVKSQFAIKSR